MPTLSPGSKKTTVFFPISGFQEKPPVFFQFRDLRKNQRASGQVAGGAWCRPWWASRLGSIKRGWPCVASWPSSIGQDIAFCSPSKLAGSWHPAREPEATLISSAWQVGAGIRENQRSPTLVLYVARRGFNYNIQISMYPYGIIPPEMQLDMPSWYEYVQSGIFCQGPFGNVRLHISCQI